MELERILDRLNNCGLSRLMGIAVTDLSPGFARATMKLKEEMANLFGSAHGGAIFSLADQASSAAGISLGRPAVAIQMNIHYLATPRVGEELTAEARVTHSGRRFGLIEGEIKDPSGQVITRSEQTFYFLDKSMEEFLGETS